MLNESENINSNLTPNCFCFKLFGLFGWFLVIEEESEGSPPEQEPRKRPRSRRDKTGAVGDAATGISSQHVSKKQRTTRGSSVVARGN